MKRHRLSPGVDLAVSRIAATIEEQKRLGRHFLPGIAELSRVTGLSRVTVYKGIHRLAGQGIVTLQPRKGIHINERLPFPADAVQTSPLSDAALETLPPRWRQIMGTLDNAVTTGLFPPQSPLPSVKQLCREHGATHATVARALATLVRRGRIARFGRGYRASLAVAAAGGARLVLIAATYDEGLHLRATPRSTELWRCLEQGCQRRGLKLETIRADEALGRGRYAIHSLLQSHSVAGFMLLPLGIGQAQLSEVLALLRRSGRPAAILDETRAVDPSVLRQAPLVRLYAMATSPIAGVDVGAYLAGAGHRRIAFAASEPADPVTANRMRGLTRAFGNAGIPDAVLLAATHPAVDVGKILEEMPAYARYRDQVIESSSCMVQAISGKRRNVSVFPFAWDVGIRELMGKMYRPVFLRLLRGDATAWVCYNDLIALAALDFLRDHNVRVPRDVSVVGFDDTLEAFSRGLTSYNFNVPAVAAAMFDHILRPSSKRTETIEIPGMVMVRASSGRRWRQA